MVESPFTVNTRTEEIGFDQLRSLVNMAIQYGKYIRIQYEKYFTNEDDKEMRTISNVQLSVNALDKEHINYYGLTADYITAFCHKRQEERTFKINRIQVLQILNL